jgi:hypothetical protein
MRIDKEEIEYRLNRTLTQREWKLASSLKVMIGAAAHVQGHALALLATMIFPRGRAPKEFRVAYRKCASRSLERLRLSLRLLRTLTKHIPKK